jgi:uncharacterized protein (TIGR03083 family)
MQIHPRYDGTPIITIADAPSVTPAFFRQRRRLASTLASLGDDGWRSPSRCDDWTVRDVAAHLAMTNRFWHGSITAGLAGSPTRMLTGFDPRATPAAMVDAARSATPSETLAELIDSGDALCTLVDALVGEEWSMIADTPPGHVPIGVLVHHALWDGWVHERDIALPLGLPVAEEPDEVIACVRFVAAFGPALALTSGTAAPAVLVLETTEPDGRVVVEVTDHVAVGDRAAPAPTLVLRDRAVHLVEALSARASLGHDVTAEHRWLVGAVGEVFESA